MGGNEGILRKQPAFQDWGYREESFEGKPKSQRVGNHLTVKTSVKGLDFRGHRLFVQGPAHRIGDGALGRNS